MAKETKRDDGLIEAVATEQGYAPLAPGQHNQMLKPGQKLLIYPEAFSKNWMKMADGSEPPIVEKKEVEASVSERIRSLNSLSIQMLRRFGNAMNIANCGDLSKGALSEAIVAAEKASVPKAEKGSGKKKGE